MAKIYYDPDEDELIPIKKDGIQESDISLFSDRLDELSEKLDAMEEDLAYCKENILSQIDPVELIATGIGFCAGYKLVTGSSIGEKLFSDKSKKD